VSSRFVALLVEKAGNPSFQLAGGTNASVHIVLPFFRLSAEGHFNRRSISKRRNNLWQFVEKAKYAGW
jgi:hypothetical protein